MKQNYSLFIFILFSFIFIINCEKDCSKCTPTNPSTSASNEELKCTGTGNECDEDCMWIRIDSTSYTCLSCDDINKGKSGYYSRGMRVNGESYCHKIGITGFKNKKIISNTKQIVANCFDLGLYELGDECYHSNPDSTNIDIIEDSTQKKLKCKYYNYKEIKDGLIYYKCLENNKRCPPEYNYFNDTTNECLYSCPTSKPKMTLIKKEGNEDIYKCSSACPDGHLKEYTKISKTYCLENCPEDAKFSYESNNKCIKNCDLDNKHFFIDQNICKENLDDCTSKYFLINPKKNYFFCQNEAFNSCPDDYPFLFESGTNGEYKYCLTSCEDTNIDYFDNIITYLYFNSNKKECLKKPQSTYFLDEKAKQWVPDCLFAIYGPFHEGDKCVENCGEKYIVEDTNECIAICQEGYFLDEELKTCVRECHDYLGRGFHLNNKCIKCGISGDGKGFHEVNNKECLTECKNGYTYNYKNNICLSGACSTHSNYKYSSSDEDKKNICYNSCLDIDDGAGAYKYELDYVCYKDKIIRSDYYFYKTFNGIYKYIKTTDAINICFNYGLKYLKDSECIQDCEEGEYKVYPTTTSFGLCFSSYNECQSKNYKFYNYDKICMNECNNGYEIRDSNNNLLLTRENCLDKCPNDYPFEATSTNSEHDQKYCLQRCPHYYIESGIKKKCQDECSDYIINENGGHKKCSKQCIKNYNDNGVPIFNYYYIKTENSEELKICVDSCNIEDLSDKYALEATNEHKPCINACPSEAPYYYENKKICLKKCDKFYDEANKCLDTCNEFIYRGNQCRNNCPLDAPFYIETIEDNVNKRECVESCVENNYDYFSEDKKCTNYIPEGKKIFNGGLVSSCISGLDSNSEKCKKPEEWTYFSINGQEAQQLTECSNSKFITTSGECVDKCPIGEHFIKTESDVNYCESKCDNYYQKEEEYTDANNFNYFIYKCSEETEPICLHIENKKHCLENEDCGKLYKYNNECKLNCGESLYSEFTNEYKHICKSDCDYYNSENMCEEECSFSSEKIITDDNEEGKKCVEECNKNSNYKYIKLINNKLHCSLSCDDEFKRYFESNYTCISKCPSSACVKENTNICIDISECQNKIFMENDEYFCLSDCPDGSYYYEDSQFCLSSCYPGDYNIQGTKICVKTCPSENDNKYFFEIDPTSSTNNPDKNSCVSDCSLTSKIYTRINNHCDNSCDSDPTGDFYIDGNNKCTTECNEKVNGNLCKSDCESTIEENQNKYEDEKGNCIQSCSNSITGYIYNNKDSFTCINECPENSFIDNNICMTTCKENTNSNIYGYNNQCVPNCPIENRFFDTDKICLENYENCPYYTTTSNPNLFECVGTCKAYVPNLDSTTIPLLCLGENCNNDYLYFIQEQKEGNTIKKCYSECPKEYYYYSNTKDSANNIECYQKCSDKELYNFKNDNKCIPLNECKYLDYKTQECVFNCTESQYIYEKEEGSLTYCLDGCSEYIGETLFLNYENKCVKTCKTDYEKQENNRCECENLFIIDKSRGIKYCLHKDEKTCEKQTDYPYLIQNTKQCSDKCDGIISLNGTDCYIDSNYECPENSDTSKKGKQCFCKYKYYYSSSLKKDLVCLPENAKCPRNETFNRELLISETNECVEFCPFEKYTKKYGKTCLELCPIMSVVVNDECFCQDKWYMNENDEMICDTQCPDIKPILIDETKQCVETCKNTKYPVYYRDKCYLNCSLFPETVQINDISNENNAYKEYNLVERYGDKGDNICFCKKAWYDDGTNYGCDNSADSTSGDGTSNKNPCEVFDDIYAYKYTYLPTKECIKECPDFSFNEYCFETCTKGNELLNGYSYDFDTESNKMLVEGDNNICKCKNLWKYKNNDLSKIECLDGDECDEDSLLIVATNECYYNTQCNDENPLLFNKKCYNQGNCPNNSGYDQNYPKTCTCKYYYYIDDSNGNIICLSENENCPTDYPNLIDSKGECVAENSPKLTDLKNYNGVYYNNCPLNTKYDSEKHLCVCEMLYGFWYKEGDNYYCGKDECPQDKIYFVGYTLECLSKCSSNGNNYVEYNGICYDECPELTKKNENGVCELQTINESKNVTEFSKIITDNIVSLYTATKNEGSENENEDEDEGDSKIIELVNSNTTIEFYGVNQNKKDKKEKHNNKDKASSSLSFIDLSECIEKIYESNNMRPDDDIIILKFDLTNTPKEYLINPVEYKFINSRNGKELDASVCGHGAIKISYPFFNIISKLDGLTNKKRNLKSVMIDLKNENDLTTLSEKYNLGKEINEQYSSIDTFNSKNNIYTDFCTAVEINGKDLILEDRMNYLLPHYSLCEKNCSYNHTDFEEERIYCDCSFKNEFDLNREHEPEIDINENAVIQSQDGETNFPVLKCISVLGDSKRIKKNIAFYYILIIIIIEIGLLTMTLILGIKAFTSFFSNKICNNDIDENNNDNNITVEMNEKDKNKNNNKYEDEIVKTTQRNLNAPPIKKNNEDNNEENNNDNNEIEFIPDEFIFLYFNDKDKGVRKQVDKKDIPFDINKNTKVLLQKMENVDYSIVKASGPFHEDQNLIEIIGNNNNNEEPVGINIESINETINDNNAGGSRNQNQNQNKLNENELITISEEKIYKRENLKNYIINDMDEIEDNKDMEKDSKGFLNEMKLEQRLLTKNYDFVVNKNQAGLLTLILTEILDKIYIIKNILFIRKYEIMYLYLSVYVLYHVILLTILAMFYDIKTIKNIWNKENYPGMGHHLGYGLLSLIISWIIYIIILCLLTIKGKYNEIINIKNSKKKNKENKIRLINKKYTSLLTNMKIKLIVYYIIQFILIVAFFIYLVTLGAVYSGTMKKIFASYGIAILEAVILKIIYGLVLGILRHYSLSNEKNGLYNIVLFFDKYIV